MHFFQKTRGLGACGREQPRGVEQPTGLGACGREQPRGVEPPTMTDEANLLEGPSLVVGAFF